MQQQTYRSRPEAAATEKQISFIKDLQGRDLISEKVDFDDLTKREASAMIDLALCQAKRDLIQKFEETSESEIIIEGDDDVGEAVQELGSDFEEILDEEPEPEEKESEKTMDSIPKVGRLDKIRFGLSAKLVYNKHEHGLDNPAGLQAFRKEVAATYQILSDLESEMSGE